MAIQAVNAASQTQTVKRKYNPAKISGYAAIALGVASGVAGNRKKIKLWISAQVLVSLVFL